MAMFGCGHPLARCAAPLLVVATPVVMARADDCAPVLAAEIAQAKVPYEITSVISEPGKPDDRRVILMVNEKMYFQMNGQWQSQPFTVQETIDRISKLAKEQPSTCAKEGAETVAGEAASIYSSRNSKVTRIVDSRIWISDRTGLPVKSDVRFADGTTTVVTYRYGDIAPPPGIK